MIDSALEVTRANALETLDGLAGLIDASGRNLASTIEMECQLAICSLLVDADQPAFIRHLEEAAAKRLELLETANDATQPDALCISRDSGFAAALVAGRLDVARAIADRSPRTAFLEIEYEDDFLLAQLQHLLVDPQPDLEAAALLLQRCEEILEDQPSSVFDVCKAIVKGDAADFAAAFEDLLADRHDWVEEQRTLLAVDPRSLAAEGRFYLAGAAWLRLAEAAGLPTEADYPMIPSLGRVPVR